MRDDFFLTASRIHDWHSTRRHGFHSRHAEMFLFSRILFNLKSVPGRVPVNGGLAVQIPNFVASRIKVEEHWRAAGFLPERLNKMFRLLIASNAACEM